MAVRIGAALLLVLIGSGLDVPIVILLGVVVLVIELVNAAWARRGLRRVRYLRTLTARRTPWGAQIPMTIEVWNRDRLPLAWLRADDEASHGVTVRERELEDADTDAAVLRNAWTLRPYERVTRRFHVGAERRGVFALGPVSLSMGDPFARGAATEERDLVDRFLVWPRTIPTVEIEPPDRWGDLQRARSGLAEDPSRFAGVRPYAPGDPVRRIHARTSARLGRPMIKRFEPSRDREVLVAIDVQGADGPAWSLAFSEDEVERLYVVAASIARSLAARRVPFGLIAAGYTGAESRIATVPVSSAPGQAERALDLLARLSSHASAPFDHLLAVAGATLRPGTTVLVLTARDPRPFATALRRLERRGADVVVITCGRDAARDAAAARDAGFVTRRAEMDGPWWTAGQLMIAP